MGGSVAGRERRRVSGLYSKIGGLRRSPLLPGNLDLDFPSVLSVLDPELDLQVARGSQSTRLPASLEPHVSLREAGGQSGQIRRDLFRRRDPRELESVL